VALQEPRRAEHRAEYLAESSKSYELDVARQKIGDGLKDY